MKNQEFASRDLHSEGIRISAAGWSGVIPIPESRSRNLKLQRHIENNHTIITYNKSRVAASAEILRCDQIRVAADPSKDRGEHVGGARATELYADKSMITVRSLHIPQNKCRDFLMEYGD